MSEKWILIVDDEEAVLSVLKNSLKKLGPEFQVHTALDGYTALEMIRHQAYDLIVTDYKMGGMNGLELLDHIKSEQSSARVILMTAFGNGALETEALRKRAYRYLTKPLEIATFRQIVKDALGEFAVSRPGILILSDERFRQISAILARLQNDVGANCVFLMDSEGHIIARNGFVEKLPLEQMASLIGAGIASLIEVGRMMDGNTDTLNLVYREGEHANLYALNIGQQLLLLILIERSAFASRLGSVWFYAQQTAVNLRQKLGEKESGSPQQMLGQNLYASIDAELESMFADDGLDDMFAEPDATAEAAPVAAPSAPAAPAAELTPVNVPPAAPAPHVAVPPAPAASQAPVQSLSWDQELTETPSQPAPQPDRVQPAQPKAPAPGDRLLTYEEAVAAGLLPDLSS